MIARTLHRGLATLVTVGRIHRVSMIFRHRVRHVQMLAYVLLMVNLAAAVAHFNEDSVSRADRPTTKSISGRRLTDYLIIAITAREKLHPHNGLTSRADGYHLPMLMESRSQQLKMRLTIWFVIYSDLPMIGYQVPQSSTWSSKRTFKLHGELQQVELWSSTALILMNKIHFTHHLEDRRRE